VIQFIQPPVMFEVSPRTYEFRIFTNYPLFIKKWRIEILDKDTKEIIKLLRGNVSDINKPIHWDNPDLDIEKQYSYRLKVYDKDGNEDTTLEKDLKVMLLDKNMTTGNAP